MSVRHSTIRRIGKMLAAACLVLAAPFGGVWAQSAPEPEAPPEFTRDEIDELVAPVALYPDDLLAIVLPASTYPLQVVQAARFLEAARTDSTLEPDESWDDAVVALLNYPEVLELLSEDLDWTWELGQAVLAQQPDVMDAVADFRARAHAAGNLRSDDRQVVEVADRVIHIKPADPQVIYVPYYEPARVIVRQAAPVYYYYPRPYPVYYYPYPVGYTFYTGFFWGVTSYYSLGWPTRYVHVHHHHHHWHPYYRATYHYDRFTYRRPRTVVHHHYHQAPRSPRYYAGNRWQPDRRHVVHSRPGRTAYRAERPPRSNVQRTERRNLQHIQRRAEHRSDRSFQRGQASPPPRRTAERSRIERSRIEQPRVERATREQRPAGPRAPARVAAAPRDRMPAASAAPRQPRQRVEPPARSQRARPQEQARAMTRPSSATRTPQVRSERARIERGYAPGRGEARVSERGRERGGDRRAFSPR